MIFLLAALTLAFPLRAAVVNADFDATPAQQASQCVLNYTGGTRSPLALNAIKSACNDLYDPLGLPDSSRAPYDTCLVQHLSGAQNDAAARQVMSACATAYPRS